MFTIHQRTALLLTFCIFHLSEAISQEHQKPNIVFVLADDLGWTDINVFDPEHRAYYETPNIDKLAAQGMKFTQAYTNAANCSPTRAALMSGQYYPHQPIYHVGDPFQGKMMPAPNAHALPPEKISLAEVLKEAGYQTGFIGKWHIGAPPATGPTEQGFDTNVGGYHAGNPGSWEGGYFQPNNNPYIQDANDGEHLTDYLTRKSIAYLEKHQHESFYLQLSYYAPHTPLQAPEQLVQKYRKKVGKGGHNNPTYAAMIELLDNGVGQLMDKLAELGLDRNTIFIFYSDNGGQGGYGYLGRKDDDITSNSPLKGGKTTFYEGGIRVPLIIRWPEVIKANSLSKEPVIGIDFYPTLLAAAGIEAFSGYQLDGLSLLPLFKKPTASLDRQALYWHFPGYPNNPWRTGPVSVIRHGPWKLMRFYETDEVELYQLDQDMSEQHNLAREQPKVRRRLQNRLEEWLTQNQAPMPRHREDNRD